MDLGLLLSDPVAAGALVGALALVLLGAAWHKVSEPAAFQSALVAYRLLPDGLAVPAARLVPLLEGGLALGLLVPATRSAALLGAAALLATYAVAMAINLARGRHHIDCGCGGSGQALSWSLVARNGVLVLLALAFSGPTTGREFTWLDGVVLVAGALSLLAAYLLADEMLRQATRMARTADETANRSTLS